VNSQLMNNSFYEFIVGVAVGYLCQLTNNAVHGCKFVEN